MDIFNILSTLGLTDIKGLKNMIKKKLSKQEFLKPIEVFLDDLDDNIEIILIKNEYKDLLLNIDFESGYEIKAKLKKIIDNEFILQNLPKEKTDEFFRLWYQEFLRKLKEYDLNKYDNILLNDEIQNLKKILEVNLYKTIEDIEIDLQRGFKKDNQFTLNFFNYEDDEFDNKLEEKITHRIIYIKAPTKEEGFYSLLSFFKNRNYRNSDILIIETYEKWEKINKDNSITNKILIPNFYNREIKPNLQNKNIFIYGEEEILNNDIDVVILRRRIISNLDKELKKLNFNYKERNEIINKTNGIYPYIKKKIFHGYFNEPKWVKILEDSKYKTILIKLILLGKWEDKDSNILEEYIENKYENILIAVAEVMNIEEPLFIKHENIYFLTSPEETYNNYINKYINKHMMKNFEEIAIKILTLIDDEYIINYKREYSLYDPQQYIYSKKIKEGILRTLIFHYMGKGENIVNDIIKIILNKKIEPEIKRAYLSNYIEDLCEVSPESILDFISEDYGMGLETILKYQSEKANILYSNRNHYISYFNVLQILLQLNETSDDTIDILFKISELKINKNSLPNPYSILKSIFCVWKREVGFTIEKIEYLAEKFVKEYNGWEFIENEILKNNEIYPGKLCKPKYLKYLKYNNIITLDDCYNLTKKYMLICLNNYNNTENLLKLININFIKLSYSLNIFNIFKEIIEEELKKSEHIKTKIKYKLRELIYENRYFERELDDTELLKILKKIVYSNPIKEYYYLFEYDLYKLPIIENGILNKKDNYKIREKAKQTFIINKLQEFKNNGYNYLDLKEVSQKQLLGWCLFIVYSTKEYKFKIIKNLFNLEEKNQDIYMGYLRNVYFENGVKELKKILELLDINNEHDKKIIFNIISIQKFNLETEEYPLIEEFNILKEKYFKTNKKFYSNNKKTWIYILENTIKYLNSNILEYLNFAKEYLTVDELLDYLLKINDSFLMPDSLDHYYMDDIFEEIHETYNGIYDKYIDIANLEIRFLGIENTKNLKFYLASLKKNPIHYLNILKVVYKQKENNKYIIPEYSQNIINLYSTLYSKLNFCPEIQNLIYWTNEFKKGLIDQKQEYLYENLLGKLFANSPKGDDEYYPHETIRNIIENLKRNEFNKFKSSFTIEMLNKRGAYDTGFGEEEMNLSDFYNKNAHHIRDKSSRTAKLYDELSEFYKKKSKKEREKATFSEITS